MGKLRQIYLSIVSEISWRLPNRPAKFMAQFSQTERGSAYDMLAAAEQTERRDLRRKYLEHALDETAHAKVFRDRANALGVGREESAIIDIGYLSDHGIIGGQTLFERLGELKFLAFVHIAEKQALEQFMVYKSRNLLDAESQQCLDRIRKDEVFHMTYSGAELERVRKKGRAEEVNKAISEVHWDRRKEAWLRFSHSIGNFVSGFWLMLIYFLLIAPFRLLARAEHAGWHFKPPVAKSTGQSTEKTLSLKNARAQF